MGKETFMKLIADREELKQKFLEVVNYLFERGEMMKAYQVICHAPSIIEEDEEILMLFSSIQGRLKDLAEMQRHGTLKGKFNRTFQDPSNIVNMVKFKKLSEEVQRLGLKRLVDVGCYTGWIGRNLNLLNIAVHGIDIQPVILFYAGIAGAGTLATYEYLPVEKLGFTHPLKYDGAILFDVLEHVFDPKIAIASVEMSVKDGGWLFYNIPHPEAEHQSARFENPDTREHLHSFSNSKLRALFNNRNKFSLEIIQNEEGGFNWWLQYKK